MKVQESSTAVEPFGLLRRQSGFTLIESLVLVVVIVVLVLSVYIGVIYAERQLLQDYRDRVATLLVTGELEMEYYRHSRSKPFELQVNKEYVIDDSNPNHILRGKMTITQVAAQETSNQQLLNFVYLNAVMRWIDPSNQKERTISMREDYFM